ALATKLSQLFEMCQPFWMTRPPQVNMKYDQVIALGCMPLPAASGGGPQFPPEVQEWTQRYVDATRSGIAVPPVILAMTTPYEIELVRYTHGARAWYLADAADWKTKYEAVLKRGAFPLHLHRSLADLPDLFPDEAAAGKQAFALG